MVNWCIYIPKLSNNRDEVDFQDISAGAIAIVSNESESMMIWESNCILPAGEGQAYFSFLSPICCRLSNTEPK